MSAHRLKVLNLLLDMPDGFAEVLIGHKCVPRILQLVELQLTRQAFQEGYATRTRRSAVPWQHVFTLQQIRCPNVVRAEAEADVAFVPLQATPV